MAMTPAEYCQKKAAESGSSFYYSFLFLPPTRRAAITALYAFCREVDDVVDEIADQSVAQQTLGWWRKEVAALFSGAPTHPVTKALATYRNEYGITETRLLEVIDGMQMDLEQTRYLDFIRLQVYCHRVAGVVGEMACSIFGYSGRNTPQYAGKLGLAFQLTNIIRDVGEDARRGRIYLPIDELQRFEVKASEILNPPGAELAADFKRRFDALMDFQTQRARTIYREAFASLDAQDRRSQRAGLIMASIYLDLLNEIERGGYRVLTGRTSLTPVRKLWLAWKTWVTARAPRVK
jgi:15-cis-phytoene synthase